MLALKNINVILNKNTRLEKKLINQLNLRVQKGEFVVIIGGNGAGKSTLFNIISGFLHPDSGDIILDGKNITHNNQHMNAFDIATVVQDPKAGTMENMTLFENLVFALKRGKRRGFTLFRTQDRKHFFKEKLKILDMGLENRLDELVYNLSGGQRQALSLIMSILSESKILLLDEITAALDPKTSETVMHIANAIVKDENRTCIMITHNLNHAITYGDRLLILKEGSFTAEYDAFSKKRLSTAELASHFSSL